MKVLNIINNTKLDEDVINCFDSIILYIKLNFQIYINYIYKEITLVSIYNNIEKKRQIHLIDILNKIDSCITEENQKKNIIAVLELCIYLIRSKSNIMEITSKKTLNKELKEKFIACFSKFNKIESFKFKKNKDIKSLFIIKYKQSYYNYNINKYIRKKIINTYNKIQKV